MDGIVDSCARIVEVDGRFEIELAESEIARVESYSNRRERAEAIVRELQQSSRERAEAIVRELQQLN